MKAELEISHIIDQLINGMSYKRIIINYDNKTKTN